MVLVRSERISSLPNGSYQLVDDRAAQRTKIFGFLTLIFSVLHVILSANVVKSQISNELAFDTMILEKLHQKSIPVDTLTGFVSGQLRSKIQLTDGAKRSLSIEEPTVVYNRVNRSTVSRRLTSVLTFRDSTEIGFQVIYQDSIPVGDLRRVRKSVDPLLRGMDPRWTAKYLGPVLLIGTGIAVIISLFYLRS